LIYAEIRQGSRTTINDELKRWKEEKTQADALGAGAAAAPRRHHAVALGRGRGTRRAGYRGVKARKLASRKKEA